MDGSRAKTEGETLARIIILSCCKAGVRLVHTENEYNSNDRKRAVVTIGDDL